MPMLKWMENQLGRLAGLFSLIGAISIIALMSVTVVAVFWRYILNSPIFGIEDISTMTLTVVVAAAIAYAAHQNAHVSVNVIKFFCGRAVTRITDAVTRILCIAMIALATYALFKNGSCGLECGQTTNNISIDHTPFYYMLGVSMGSYTLLLVVQLLVGFVHWNGNDPNEAID